MANNRVRSLDDTKQLVRRAEGLLESFVLAVVYYYVWKEYYRIDFGPTYYGRGKVVLIFIYFSITVLSIRLCEGFKFGHLKFSDVFISQVLAILMANFITFWQLSLIAAVMVIVWPMILLTGIDILISLFCCYLFTALYHGHYVPRNMILIYGKDSAIDLKFKMDLRMDRYTITKIVRYDVGLEQIKKAISEHDSVILNDIPAQMRNDILKYCYHNEIRTYIVPKITDIIIKGAPDINLFDTPLMLVKGRGLTASERFTKRILDIVLCLIVMIPFLIILLLVAVAIKLDDNGPVFYTQDRLTRDLKVFKIYKFRSMKVHSESEETFQGAETDDPRITKVGRFIRRTRIDELPQIINIMKGDMSFVGVRPEHIADMKKHEAEIPEYSERYKVKAGLTGYAQVYGKYNTSPYDKLRMDLMYIENYSLIQDVKLILMTLRTLTKDDSTEGFDKMEERKARREEVIKDSLKGDSQADMDKR